MFTVPVVADPCAPPDKPLVFAWSIVSAVTSDASVVTIVDQEATMLASAGKGRFRIKPVTVLEPVTSFVVEGSVSHGPPSTVGADNTVSVRYDITVLPNDPTIVMSGSRGMKPYKSTVTLKCLAADAPKGTFLQWGCLSLDALTQSHEACNEDIMGNLGIEDGLQSEGSGLAAVRYSTLHCSTLHVPLPAE